VKTGEIYEKMTVQRKVALWAAVECGVC